MRETLISSSGLINSGAGVESAKYSEGKKIDSVHRVFLRNLRRTANKPHVTTMPKM